eukprot:UN03245
MLSSAEVSQLLVRNFRIYVLRNLPPPIFLNYIC